MPIPGPGTAISMTTIATEFGGTVPHSLSEYYRGGGLVPNTPTNSAIPTSGQIAMGNFYGSANRSAISLVLSGNTYNYDVFTNRGPTYVAGASDITVTVNPGVTVGSTSTGTYAMLVPSSFNPGDTVTIVNQGVIQGMGGGGGTGGIGSNPSSQSTAGSPGAGGGNAIYVNRPTTITNNGVIASGGGGGGGGGGGRFVQGKGSLGTWGGAGGGGGAGFNGGGGGAGGPFGQAGPSVSGNGNPGQSGSSPAGGAGGPSAFVPQAQAPSAAGGAGGGRGAGGSGGQPAINSQQNAAGGGGGGAGSYIVGNPFVTYPATGTRQGNVS
jgi:hypothetical protein